MHSSVKEREVLYLEEEHKWKVISLPGPRIEAAKKWKVWKRQKVLVFRPWNVPCKQGWNDKRWKPRGHPWCCIIYMYACAMLLHVVHVRGIIWMCAGTLRVYSWWVHVWTDACHSLVAWLCVRARARLHEVESHEADINISPTRPPDWYVVKKTVDGDNTVIIG